MSADVPPREGEHMVHGWRFRLEVGLAALNALLFVATVAWPEWIEAIFGIEPDHGDGSLEWLILGVTALCAIGASLRARADWRALHDTAEDPVR
jgi:hypothetical protein